MLLFASKLYIQLPGVVTLLEDPSIRYFINAIAILFSIVEPPTPPMSNGGRPPATRFVGETGESGMTRLGHMLSDCRLPGAIELAQPGRGSNRAIPCPNTRPRLVTPPCAPKEPPMLKVKSTQFPHWSEVEILQVP